jgi:uncharacterized alpha-E superfamily protein
VRFCIQQADDSLHQIAGSPGGSYRNVAEQRLGRLKSELAYSDVTSIVNQGLHEFVDGLQTKLNRIGEGIHETFFAMRPLGSGGNEAPPAVAGPSESQSQGQSWRSASP